MSGDDVKALQELLMQLGYDLPKYGADGKFGSETKRAVIGFQTDEGLKADGLYGNLTHAALMNQSPEQQHRLRYAAVHCFHQYDSVREMWEEVSAQAHAG